ncbi:MAG: urease accessory protein UreF [Verrucomicrobia bacterium]|nr:urease accessory protein UreF [Verrucomicrobiota bacterium]
MQREDLELDPQISPSDWVVWQLIDSAFPTGGFAHSAGLESAWKHGEIRNPDELSRFVETSQTQCARSSLPFVNTAHREPSRLLELDALCEAFTTNHVANRASRSQGHAWLAAIEKTFGAGSRTSLRRPDGARPAVGTCTDAPSGRFAMHAELDGNKPNGNLAPMLDFLRADMGDSFRSHFSPVFGATAAWLGILRPLALRMFLFMHLRGLMAAAIRLGISGPMEAQILQRALSLRAEEVLLRCGEYMLDELAQTAPLPDLWQASQDRLYSRLFRS